MEPSFWSWEKQHQAQATASRNTSRNGAQLLELGKGWPARRHRDRDRHPAMEPSFWSWEKINPGRRGGSLHRAAMEPSFWSWEKKIAPLLISHARSMPQWSPAFGAGKSHRSPNLLRPGSSAAMEPSFWSWEKRRFDPWLISKICAAMEPSFWSWEKSSRFFHQLTTSVAHLCEQRKFWGRRVGLLLPDRLGKLALTRARALPRGTEGAGALARRSAGLGWVAPRGLQRI